MITMYVILYCHYEKEHQNNPLAPKFYRVTSFEIPGSIPVYCVNNAYDDFVVY